MKQHKARPAHEILETGVPGTVVKWTDRGYGFIRSACHTKDVFVHIRQIAGYPARQSLDLHTPVVFDLARSDKGYIAVNVR